MGFPALCIRSHAKEYRTASRADSNWNGKSIHLQLPIHIDLCDAGQSPNRRREWICDAGIDLAMNFHLYTISTYTYDISNRSPAWFISIHWYLRSYQFSGVRPMRCRPSPTNSLTYSTYKTPFSSIGTSFVNSHLFSHIPGPKQTSGLGMQTGCISRIFGVGCWSSTSAMSFTGSSAILYPGYFITANWNKQSCEINFLLQQFAHLFLLGL